MTSFALNGWTGETGTNSYKQVQTVTNRYKQVQTGTHWIVEQGALIHCQRGNCCCHKFPTNTPANIHCPVFLRTTSAFVSCCIHCPRASATFFTEVPIPKIVLLFLWKKEKMYSLSLTHRYKAWYFQDLHILKIICQEWFTSSKKTIKIFLSGG